MRKRAWVVLLTLAALAGAGGLLQTPGIAHARSAAWSAWTATLGRWLEIGPLAVPNNVTEQLMMLRSENIRLQTELADYRRLRQQLGAPAFADFTAIPAEVTAEGLDPWQAHYILNRGAAQGVTLGAPVVVFDSMLVGFVDELHEHTAAVRLLFHPETSLPVDVVVAADNLQRALAAGRSFTALELHNIPQDVVLTEGQTVVTASQSARVPAGLLLGTLRDIAEEPNTPWQRAIIEVPYDSDQLRAVAILTPLSQ